MSDQELERMLFERLSVNEVMLAKGFTVELNDRGHVIVDRDGHVKGVWRVLFGVLEWTPAGYNGPKYRVASVDAGEQHTLIALGLASI